MQVLFLFIIMASMENTKITIIGTGAWGTSLAISLHNAAKNVSLWGRRPEYVNELITTRHSVYLTNITIPNTLSITNDVNKIVSAEVILWVAPVQQSEQLLKSLKDYIPKEIPIVICSKGLELKSKKSLSSLFETIITNPIGVLSGPNFADEVALGLPAASTLAFAELDMAKNLAIALRHRTFRVYAHMDVVGVEMFGALKNVMAIAAGIVMGKNLGHNCLATLITRANAEIRRIVTHFGGTAETCQTLAGIGDLILTCSSAKSRNTSLGIALAAGGDLETILSTRHNVTEGVATAKVAFELTQEHNIYAPIISAVYQILHCHSPIDAVVESLLSHQQQQELS